MEEERWDLAASMVEEFTGVIRQYEEELAGVVWLDLEEENELAHRS
jgi:hypothetical protein